MVVIPYSPYNTSNKADEDDKNAIVHVFAINHSWKIVNGYIAALLFAATVALAITSLILDFKTREFPTSIVTHTLRPWNEYGGLEDALKAITTGSTSSSRVQALWHWAKCDQYITDKHVPHQHDPYTLAGVSVNNSVWVPGGCNCIAQVAHALGNTWVSTQTTSPTLSEVKDMIHFCAYEGDMPYQYDVVKTAYRPLYYFYYFMFVATSAIVMANFLHSSNSETIKTMIKNNVDPKTALDESKSLLRKLVLYFVLTFIVVIVFTGLFLGIKNSCDQDICNFDPVTTLSLMSVFLVILFVLVIPYFYQSSKTHIVDALQMMVNGEHDSYTIAYRDANDATVYKVSDSLNSQAQLEQLWLDVMLVPAMVALSIGTVLTRQWTDNGILYYYAVLVGFFTVVSMSNDWMTSFWTRSLRLSGDLGMKGSAVYDHYQGYKDMVTYVQLFILVALIFTAVPTESITAYSYILFYNWLYFVFGLFAVYMLPDFINDRAALNIHTVTAMKQTAVLLLVFTLVITLSVTEWVKKDIFAYQGLV
ncbi:hypothetical protein GUITHDRAFT_119034 [Guillardia theta CCMP2712]|uniref:Uncharacterized protein n=1 Tax=Guillardia theta (strain CCMP2712) TaxID=905079 RepID=L1IG20_GUITC|nr:hypothetical protein GUITHDRAFT_119034 [Guillardia theta CCMP2712]EKX34849.1 hypothetical protein GUITHDRAFT_119034 [Guillardia theta CCMP2712]|eukprot:XP_005821829.1 hypothetical protein GUITHDRAFT_119034 [Guillardia theta CCMP2712]